MKKIYRENVIELIGAIRDIIEKEIELSEYLGEDFSKIDMEQNELETYFQGVSNGFLAEIVQAIIGYEVEVNGEVEQLFPCPCCGFRTLTEPYDPDEGTGYDICPYCNWEDDGTIEINSYRSINKGSIQDYRNNMRRNFNKYYINKWFYK